MGPSRAQTRYRILVLIAVVGLVLLAVASAALVSPGPAPTSFVERGLVVRPGTADADFPAR